MWSFFLTNFQFQIQKCHLGEFDLDSKIKYKREDNDRTWKAIIIKVKFNLKEWIENNFVHNCNNKMKCDCNMSTMTLAQVDKIENTKTHTHTHYWNKIIYKKKFDESKIKGKHTSITILLSLRSYDIKTRIYINRMV